MGRLGHTRLVAQPQRTNLRGSNPKSLANLRRGKVPDSVETSPESFPETVNEPETMPIAQIQGDSVEAVLEATEIEAAKTLNLVARGKMKGILASTRAEVSLAVLQGRGRLGLKPGAGGQDVDELAGKVFGAMERALRFRSRREGAEDGKILASGTVIEAEKPTDSGG